MSGTIADMKSQHWNTPSHILDGVRSVFGGPIDLDPCDNEYSITQPRVSFQLPVNDGLKNDWGNVSDFLKTRIDVFCNPPFGRSDNGTSIADWVEKCFNEYHATKSKINSIILLLPASTETVFWHKYIWSSATSIAFLKGRVAFPLEGKVTGFSPKGTALVYWGVFGSGNVDKFKTVFSEMGKVVTL
jgi:hypothetical protein